MKRKMTELETQLVETGWCLTHKNYKGKLAKRIESYGYEKIYDHRFKFKLYLNPKREEIVGLILENPYYYVGVFELSILNAKYKEVDNELKRLCCFVDTLKGGINDKV